MFDSINMAPIDPILGLAERFKNDPRPNKINLGIGVYSNEAGKVPILASVKQAELMLQLQTQSKNYLPIEGAHDYLQCTQKILLGDLHTVIKQRRLCTLHTPGGTGALAVVAAFLAKHNKNQKILLSNPTWANHYQIFTHAGITIGEYDYYDICQRHVNFDKMVESLKKEAKSGDAILLHACCHNPTGADLSSEQWCQMAQLCREKNWLPIFDIAYQGFANNIEIDNKAIKIFSEKLEEIIICSSYSKNFSLYNERVGACTFITKSQIVAQTVLSQAKTIARVLYSNPPAHGAAIVSSILLNNHLKEKWITELAQMQNRIQKMRVKLSELLQQHIHTDFSYLTVQNGMFSFIGLTNPQTQQLRDDFAIHMADSGRINIAGITDSNINRIAKSIAAVLNA